MFTGSGNAFTDVQTLDGNTALVTGSAGAKTLDLTSGTFTSVSNASECSGNAILSRDGSLTLLAETSISDGPLFVYDETTHAVTAHVTDNETPTRVSTLASRRSASRPASSCSSSITRR